MLKRTGILVFQILLVSLVLFSSYYFLFLKPKIELEENKTAAIKTLTLFENALTQNRLSYVSLTKLDPDSTNFDSERTNALKLLKSTQEDISKYADMYNSISFINQDLSTRFPALLTEIQDVNQKQMEIMDAVYKTKSYEEGLLILKSDEAVKILTDETNLILEIKHFVFRIQNLEFRI